MEFYQLRSFVTVARENHLTRAAEQLHISQPAVSAHIKSLEEELGQPLFFRTPSGMLLTPEGEYLCRQAKVILQEAAQFTRIGENLLNRPVGTVRIGLNRNAEFLRISTFYKNMRQNCSNIEIILHQSISGTILRRIKAGELDCGFILGDAEVEGLSHLYLDGFFLRVVGPIALRSKLMKADLAMLADLPWIGIPDDCAYSRIVKKYFQDRGLRLRVEVVADQHTAIVSMIQSGVGLNFMLEEEAVLAEKNGQVVLWSGEGFPIDLFFVWRSEDTDSTRMKAILAAMTATWPQAKEGGCQARRGL